MGFPREYLDRMNVSVLPAWQLGLIVLALNQTDVNMGFIHIVSFFALLEREIQSEYVVCMVDN